MPAATPDPAYAALREAPIVDAVPVNNLVIKRDAGVLTLKSGSLGFTAPSMGRHTVAVFVGDGEFVLEPGIAVEKNHLRTIIGQDAVRESFDRALFCFTDDSGKELRATGAAGAADPKLAEALRDYRKKLRYRPDQPKSDIEDMVTSETMDNVDAEILADLYNPAQRGFFMAYIHGRKYDDLRFMVRPRGALPSMPAPEEVALVNVDPQADEEGIWYLAHLQTEKGGAGSPDEDKRTVEAASYKIETTIAKNDHLNAKAEFRYRGVNNGDRVIKFGLLPALRVLKVTAGGSELPFIQEDRKQDGSFYVVLPEPIKTGAEGAVTIEYQGDKVLEKEGGGNFSVGARTSWYPSVNAFLDRAQYDLTFKVPKQYVLVGVGKLVKEWKEQDFACSQWVSEVPLAVAGFNYGSFDKKQVVDEATKIQVEGYATSEMPDYIRAADREGVMSPKSLTARTISETQTSLRIYEAYFGKSEFGRVAVTQQPAFNFGQSWPTLVYLPISAYLDSTQRWKLIGLSTSMTEFIDEVTPHEVSHQWWGHMVGWKTYHDQWLSEGFANFSAGLYLQISEKDPDKFLNYWEQSRKRMLEKNSFGRRSVDAGPLTLGTRLDSPKNPRAYSDLVYDKGGYILHMLRQMMWDSKEGDKYFIAMMQEFVREHMNKNATTESFQRIAEKHIRPVMNLSGNGKLDWFFSEWVHGSAIPKYKFDNTVTQQPDGKWLLNGVVTQSEVTPDFAMVVPIYADFDGKIMRLGAVRLMGNSSFTLNVMLPQKPKRVMINAWHDVLEQ
jgi:hypothetical protein